MTRIPLILACLLAPAAAFAQNTPVAPGALDLSVPQEPIRYQGDPVYQGDAPGTYYGDHSGRGLPAKNAQADVVDDKLQVHGSVTTGIGYSKQTGNSNWTSANINLGKNYTNDEGETRRFDLNINVGRSEGAGFYGPGFGYGYGPGPYRGGGW